MSNFNSRGFPYHRGRRLRSSSNLRDIVSQVKLSLDDLVMPYFIKEIEDNSEIKNMPGILRYDENEILFQLEKLIKKGIKAVALFPKISEENKTPDGIEALNENNLICRTLRNIKKKIPEILVFCDVALDPYTSTGHDGIVNRKGEIDNDITIDTLSKMSVLLANNGCDIVSPSDMMDGRVKIIRSELEKSKNINTCIMSYSAKFASGFYSPFRDALGNLKNLGKTDKKTYQIDFRNQNEAIKESLEDIYEGADIIMVKPAIYYLDIVNILKEKCLIPIAAYQVSGEYSMIKIAAEKNMINLKDTVLESLIGIKRSGADIIFSYFAEEVSEWLK